MKTIHINPKERKIQILLFVFLFVFLLMGKSTQVIDSNFNLLLSHNLYSFGDADVGRYLNQKKWDEVVAFQAKSGVLRVEETPNDRKIYLTYPSLPSYLAIPFVWIADTLGWPVAKENPNEWIDKNEVRLQLLIASILIALCALLIYQLSRLWLSTEYSLFLILPLILGSAFSSTLSRALWTDTWATLFVVMAIHHLAKVHHQQSSLKCIYVVALTLLAFFCKPIYALSAIPLMAWMFWLLTLKYEGADRGLINREFKNLALLGVVLFIVFFYLSHSQLGFRLLSNYSFNYFSSFDSDYLLGQFISPSRGVLIFWSWIIPLFAYITIMWKQINNTDRRLIYLSLIPCLAIVAILSFYPQWHGGTAYGPRLNIPALPWLVLMSIITLSHWVKIKSENATSSISIMSKVGVFATLILIAWSVIVNIYGTVMPKTFYAWHRVAPIQNPNLSISSKEYQQVFWNWRDPIFLAGIIKPERYFNYTISVTDPIKAQEAMNQIQTKTDLLDVAMGRKKLMSAPSSSTTEPSNTPSRNPQ